MARRVENDLYGASFSHEEAAILGGVRPELCDFWDFARTARAGAGWGATDWNIRISGGAKGNL